MKRDFFGSHPDDPVILHRKELVNQKHPFQALAEPDVQSDFNARLLRLLEELDYVVITIVVDKLEHHRRYSVWRFDPYHYCLTAMVERYVLWLRDENTVGDVMAESRGGKEDRRLKDSFERVFERGSDFVLPAEFASRLTSRQLKVKAKSSNIAGLQLADLIAHPSFIATKARREAQALPENFGGQIAQILESAKYRRRGADQIDGWGRKWLP